MPRRLIMVCHGNICRSPMAAAVARALLEASPLAGAYEVTSAGTSAEHLGEPIDPRAAAALRRAGWPVPQHRARQLRATDIAPGDLVLAADRANLRALARLELPTTPLLLGSFDPTNRPGDEEIPDPWFGDDRAFEEALARIERACTGLLAHLRGEAPPKT